MLVPMVSVIEGFHCITNYVSHQPLSGFVYGGGGGVITLTNGKFTVLQP